MGYNREAVGIATNALIASANTFARLGVARTAVQGSGLWAEEKEIANQRLASKEEVDLHREEIMRVVRDLESKVEGLTEDLAIEMNHRVGTGMSLEDYFKLPAWEQELLKGFMFEEPEAEEPKRKGMIIHSSDLKDGDVFSLFSKFHDSDQATEPRPAWEDRWKNVEVRGDVFYSEDGQKMLGYPTDLMYEIRLLQRNKANDRDMDEAPAGTVSPGTSTFLELVKREDRGWDIHGGKFPEIRVSYSPTTFADNERRKLVYP